MKLHCSIFVFGALLQTRVAAVSIPSNIQSLYSSIQNSGSCTGTDLLQGGFHDTNDGSPDYGYCQKGVAGKAIYLKGPDTKLANMDVDCDGEQNGLDARCQASTDTQAQTAFQAQVQQYGISDLRADIHPYAVFGNEGNYTPTFDPQKAGVLPLSIVAVVCGDQLVYAVWGDTNGDDGKPLVGEASLATATACYGRNISGDNGHDDEDVLYIAFVGDKAVPGTAARWNASSYEEFEASIASLGDELVASLPSSVSAATASTATASSQAVGYRSYTGLAMLIALLVGTTLVV